MHTVQFSNHPGYGDWRGRVFDADLDPRGGRRDRCARRARRMRRRAVGLHGVGRDRRGDPRGGRPGEAGQPGRGLLLRSGDRRRRARRVVRTGIPALMRERAVPAADVVTPNHFELEQLAGRAAATLADVLDAVEAVHRSGPRTVARDVPSHAGNPEERGRRPGVRPDGRLPCAHPVLSNVVNGAGDMIAALFFGQLLRSGSAPEALSLRGVGDLRRARSHRRGRLARAAAGRGAGGDRRPAPGLRGGADLTRRITRAAVRHSHH